MQWDSQLYNGRQLTGFQVADSLLQYQDCNPNQIFLNYVKR